MDDHARARTRSSRRGSQLLFVYGTLRPVVATPMAHWLCRSAEHLGIARTRGRLYDLGPYPGMVDASARQQWVVGDLFRLHAPLHMLRALDRYERGPAWRGRAQFRRVEREVFVGPKRWLAWLYLYVRPVWTGTRLLNGDYVWRAP